MSGLALAAQAKHKMETVFSDSFASAAIPAAALLGIFFALWLWWVRPQAGQGGARAAGARNMP